MTRVPFFDMQAHVASIRGELDAAIAGVLDSGRFVTGPEVTAFCAEFAAFCGARFAIGCSNGTTALQALLACSGIGPGDEVVCPSHTFIATMEAIRHTGAKPVMVDIDEGSMLMSADAARAAITARTRAIVPVHLYGCPVGAEVVALAREKGLLLLEDSAQAHGASLGDRRAGAIGDGASFSFFPAKNLGAICDSGAVTTSDERLAKAVRLYVDHGREDKYTHVADGTNWRMNSLQAAVLRVKLRHLPEWTRRRQALAARYGELLAAPTFAGGVRVQEPPPGAVGVYHLMVVRVGNRDAVQKRLAETGIETGIHYPIPCHLQPALGYLGYRRGQFPATEQACAEILSLPIYPEMPMESVDIVVDALFKAL